jgi:hypothetical protein
VAPGSGTCGSAWAQAALCSCCDEVVETVAVPEAVVEVAVEALPLELDAVEDWLDRV